MQLPDGGRFAKVGRYDLFHLDRGQGEPVLLVHGLAGDHTGWTPQIAAWSAQARIIAPDSRGAGRSTQVDEPISTEEMADDFLALMDGLGIPAFHVVGRSMGGCIGQHMALKAPRRVKSLALLASAARFDPIGHRVLANMREVLELTGSWAAHARHSVQNFVSHRFFNDNPERVAAIEALIGGETRLPACYIRQNHAVLAHDALDRLREIEAPTLILSGGRDPICSPLATRWMAERLPRAEWTEFEDSSHFFLMEEPDRFMALMAGWLARHAA